MYQYFLGCDFVKNPELSQAQLVTNDNLIKVIRVRRDETFKNANQSNSCKVHFVWLDQIR